MRHTYAYVEPESTTLWHTVVLRSLEIRLVFWPIMDFSWFFGIFWTLKNFENLRPNLYNLWRQAQLFDGHEQTPFALRRNRKADDVVLRESTWDCGDRFLMHLRALDCRRKRRKRPVRKISRDIVSTRDRAHSGKGVNSFPSKSCACVQRLRVMCP